MMNAKELKGRWLVSADDGAKIGTIKEIFLTADASGLAAVDAGTTGLLRRTSWLVPADAVQLFGIDVWLVPKKDSAVELDDFRKENEVISMAELRGREIVTAENQPIGIILDAILDEEMKVSGFRIGKVEKENPLAKSKKFSHTSIMDVGSKEKPVVIDLNKAIIPVDVD